MKKRIMYLFVIIQIILFCCFVTLDLLEINSADYVKFASIFVCFLFALFTKKAPIMFKIAITFTLLADFVFMVIPETTTFDILAISLFICTQTAYFFMLKHKVLRLLIRIFISLPIFLINTDIVTKLACFYFIQICDNLFIVIQSYLKTKKPEFGLLIAGFSLFILCDISIGIFNAVDTQTISDLAVLLIWVFYLPSQVIITLAETT